MKYFLNVTEEMFTETGRLWSVTTWMFASFVAHYDEIERDLPSGHMIIAKMNKCIEEFRGYVSREAIRQWGVDVKNAFKQENPRQVIIENIEWLIKCLPIVNAISCRCQIIAAFKICITSSLINCIQVLSCLDRSNDVVHLVTEFHSMAQERENTYQQSLLRLETEIKELKEEQKQQTSILFRLLQQPSMNNDALLSSPLQQWPVSSASSDCSSPPSNDTTSTSSTTPARTFNDVLSYKDAFTIMTLKKFTLYSALFAWFTHKGPLHVAPVYTHIKYEGTTATCKNNKTIIDVVIKFAISTADEETKVNLMFDHDEADVSAPNFGNRRLVVQRACHKLQKDFVSRLEEMERLKEMEPKSIDDAEEVNCEDHPSKKRKYGEKSTFVSALWMRLKPFSFSKTN